MSKYTKHIAKWMRYIDDIFLIWTGPVSLFLEFADLLNINDVGLELTKVYHQSDLVFLDLNISIDHDNSIKTNLFRKPTATNNLLSWESYHPEPLRRSIPIGQYLRARRNCSSLALFQQEANKLRQMFRSRGYPSRWLKQAFQRALLQDRESLIQKNSYKNWETDNKTQTIRWKTIREFRRRVLEHINCITSHLDTSISRHVKSYHNSNTNCLHFRAIDHQRVTPRRAKKKFNFKSFKKFFGKMKRKETLPPLGSSGLKQSQSASDVTMPDSVHMDDDSEDETDSTAGVLGSRAVSHDSIFIPEMVQESARPGRVFSQENVSDRIRALQAKLQSNIRHGPPPFGILTKRMDDAGTSSEDDGLPRSPPEMSLIHETLKTRFSDHHKELSSLSLAGTGSEEDEQFSSGHSSRPLSPEETQLTYTRRSPFQNTEGSPISPSADFDSPAQLSTFLDSSAAKHRLSIKPRNQRISKNRRPSATLQGDPLADLASTEEEPEYNPDEAMSTPTKLIEDQKWVDIVKAGPSHSPNSQPSGVSNILPLSLEEKKNRITMEAESQVTEEQAQLSSKEVDILSTINSQAENNKSKTDMKAEKYPKAEHEVVEGSTSKTHENAPHRLSAAENYLFELVLDKNMPSKQGQSLTSHLSGNEKGKLPKEPIQDLINEKLLVAQETVVAKSKTDQLGHMMDSTQSIKRSSQLPSNAEPSYSRHERFRSTQEQPDKENNKLVGSVDKKLEKPTSDIASQRKFSVSSAWERPRGGSLSMKGNAEGETVKNMTLSLPKSGMPISEKEKDDPRPPGTFTEIKASGRKKENLADSESTSADKAALGFISPTQTSVPSATDMPVVTDSQAGTEEKNPFFVKLRTTSMSLRYRDGTNPDLNRVKRHSAEIRQEKTGQLTLCKEDFVEVTNTGVSSTSENMKYITSFNELIQAKPPLAKKPVLQNITVADNNTNKEASDCVLHQEKKTKSPESRTEKLSERRASQKNMEKSTSLVTTPQSAKGTESKGQPSWISMALQKQKSLKEEQPTTEDRSVNKEAEKQIKDRAEALLKQQGNSLQNKTTTATGFPELFGHEVKEEVKEQRQRANTLSHPVPAEKEEKTVRQVTQSVSGEPSWMELAKKKSQAWNDMPQIIK
ncbi:CRACD-like protein [Pelodytes ibericus]